MKRFEYLYSWVMVAASMKGAMTVESLLARLSESGEVCELAKDQEH